MKKSKMILRFQLALLLLFFGIYDLYSQNITIIPPIGHTSQITDVDVSPDGKIILSSSIDKTLILWDYATGFEIAKLSGTD